MLSSFDHPVYGTGRTYPASKSTQNRLVILFLLSEQMCPDQENVLCEFEDGRLTDLSEASENKWLELGKGARETSIQVVSNVKLF